MKNTCPYYRKCSGCSQLGVAYAKQLRDKSLLVRKVLTEAMSSSKQGSQGLSPADLDSLFLPLVPSPLPLGYRASTKLALHADAFGERHIGLYQRGTKTVVNIPECPVHAAPINKIVKQLFAGRAPLPAPLYEHARRSFQPGRLKFVTVRLSPATGMIGLIVSHTGVDRQALKDWAERVAQPHLSLHESVLTKADDDRILSEATTHLAGPESFQYAIAGTTFALPPLAFFQANFSLTEAFVSAVAGGLKGGTLLDLYGGFGAYSWATRGGFERIYLVDGNDSAVAAARTQTPSLAGLEAVHASVEDFLARRLKPREAKAVTHAIVNPPRAGLSPKVTAALGLKMLPSLQQLTYVSCNLDTLARDLRALTSLHPLRLTSVEAFDMFPQTGHIEVVAKLAPW